MNRRMKVELGGPLDAFGQPLDVDRRCGTRDDLEPNRPVLGLLADLQPVPKRQLERRLTAGEARSHDVVLLAGRPIAVPRPTSRQLKALDQDLLVEAHRRRLGYEKDQDQVPDARVPPEEDDRGLPWSGGDRGRIDPQRPGFLTRLRSLVRVPIDRWLWRLGAIPRDAVSIQQVSLRLEPRWIASTYSSKRWLFVLRTGSGKVAIKHRIRFARRHLPRRGRHLPDGAAVGRHAPSGSSVSPRSASPGAGGSASRDPPRHWPPTTTARPPRLSLAPPSWPPDRRDQPGRLRAQRVDPEQGQDQDHNRR